MEPNEIDIAELESLAAEIDRWAIEKGWKQEQPREFAELAMLVVTELAEAVEAIRNGSQDEPCDKAGCNLTCLQEELADTGIRLLQAISECAQYGYEVNHVLDYSPTPAYDNPVSSLWMVVAYLGDIGFAAALAQLYRVASSLGVDIIPAMKTKMAYNWTRPARHGGKKH